MSITVVLSSLVVIAVLALAACGDLAIGSGGPERDSSAHADIYVVNADGTGLKQLTNDLGWLREGAADQGFGQRRVAELVARWQTDRLQQGPRAA